MSGAIETRAAHDGPDGLDAAATSATTPSATALQPLLSVRGLTVAFNGHPAVEHVDFDVSAGEVLGIVGESGSGKSMSMLALMGLVDAPGKVTAERIAFAGSDLLNASPRARRAVIGKEIAMIFQDPMSSLNPAYTVGFQIREVLRQHEGLRGAALQRRVLELLDQVEIPDAKNRANAYVHQLSGGMSQRVMIAMAIACNPKLLIADEPTTALDVTIQAQIMRLLKTLQAERHMSLILISHDLAVVGDAAQRVAVMYAGEIVETQPAPDIFMVPHHPYTAALLAAIPERNRGAARLAALPGLVPGRADRPHGCLFSPRCGYAVEACRTARPALAEIVPGARARCIKPLHTAGIAVVPGEMS